MGNLRIVPFGKYKGQPLEILAQDPGYCEWFLAQDNIKRQFPALCQIVINNFYEPNDTPEHNRLQVRFLDDTFCTAVEQLCNWKVQKENVCNNNLNRAIESTSKILANNKFNSNYEMMDRFEELLSWKSFVNYHIREIDSKDFFDPTQPFSEIKKVFEQDGWDIIIQKEISECKKCIIYKNCDKNKNKINLLFRVQQSVTNAKCINSKHNYPFFQRILHKIILV